jgi:hypothetical protein
MEEVVVEARTADTPLKRLLTPQVEILEAEAADQTTTPIQAARVDLERFELYGLELLVHSHQHVLADLNF